MALCQDPIEFAVKLLSLFQDPVDFGVNYFLFIKNTLSMQQTTALCQDPNDIEVNYATYQESIKFVVKLRSLP